MKDFSIMTFGSVNRGDDDEHSDKDLLVVIPNVKDYDRDQYSSFISQDHSVSYYNYAKLEYIASKGNLFIQHLKQQGSIISDESGRLQEILINFKPLNDYNNELKNAIRFKEIFFELPKATIANGWIFDLLYIAVRNVLVFMSAVDETYHFGYKVLLAEYTKSFNLDANDVIILLNLRITKQLYRNNPHFIEVTHENLCKTICSCEKIIGPISVNFLSINGFNKYVRELIETKSKSEYAKLRLLEGLYNCYSNRIATMENIISRPQFYMYQAKKNRKLILWYNIINDAKKY
jgi:hypothetical protein